MSVGPTGHDFGRWTVGWAICTGGFRTIQDLGFGIDLLSEAVNGLELPGNLTSLTQEIQVLMDHFFFFFFGPG